MKASKERARISIALTEKSPTKELWRAAMEHLADPGAELTVLFVTDDRWHRAASLPVTREISRIGGVIAEFTLHRAEQLSGEAIVRARRRIEELAAEAGLALGFEVLSESDQERFRELVAGARNILIAPSFISSRPLFTRVTELECRIVLVEAKEEDDQHE